MTRIHEPPRIPCRADSLISPHGPREIRGTISCLTGANARGSVRSNSWRILTRLRAARFPMPPRFKLVEHILWPAVVFIVPALHYTSTQYIRQCFGVGRYLGNAARASMLRLSRLVGRSAREPGGWGDRVARLAAGFVSRLRTGDVAPGSYSSSHSAAQHGYANDTSPPVTALVALAGLTRASFAAIVFAPCERKPLRIFRWRFAVGARGAQAGCYRHAEPITHFGRRNRDCARDARSMGDIRERARGRALRSRRRRGSIWVSGPEGDIRKDDVADWG